MPSRKRHFRQADVTAAIKGAAAGGLKIGKIEIEPEGTIVIHTGEPQKASESDLDKWLEIRDARSA